MREQVLNQVNQFLAKPVISEAIHDCVGTFTSVMFWQKSLIFLSLFLLMVFVCLIPVVLWLGRKTPVWIYPLLPVLGMANLLLLLQIPINLIYFQIMAANKILAMAALLYLIEVGLIWIIKKNGSSLKILASFQFWSSLSMPLAMYGIFFILITSAYFSSQTQNFFVPGYEINHDAITILNSSKVIGNNELIGSSVAGLKKFIQFYPLGGTALILFFGQIYNQDIYYVYAQLVVAIFLLVIFDWQAFILQIARVTTRSERWFFYLAVTASVWNYLSIAILNVAILGSTSIMPFLLALMFVSARYNDNEVSANLLIQFLCLAGMLFLYGYLTWVLIILFALINQIIQKKFSLAALIRNYCLPLIPLLGFHFILLNLHHGFIIG